jgi:aspartate kinase
MQSSMAITVQKYGGSSVANVERLRKVADRVATARQAGKDVVVVVSAMGDTTDELLRLAREVSDAPARRELDMLLSSGERISMALLAMALNARGTPAVSFTGSQSGIITNDDHTNARIVEVRPFRVQDELACGKVVIVAGYQGVSYKREVTTLGRGGSDTTAVALAAALDAEACEIYSDVDGIYTADPRVVPTARRLSEISYEEMQELAYAGARVLNAQAVEFAREKGIVLYARATAGGEGQTLVRRPAQATGSRVVGVASEGDLVLLDCGFDSDRSLLPLLGLLEEWKVTTRQVHAVGDASARGRLALLVPLENLHDYRALRARLEEHSQGTLGVREDVACVSIVGTGLGAAPGTLARALRAAGGAARETLGFFASPLRVSLLVDAPSAPDAVRSLHDEFLPPIA